MRRPRSNERDAPDAPPRCLSWKLCGGAGDAARWASWSYTHINYSGSSEAEDGTMRQIMDGSLVGKVALVVGATRGAGRAIAVQLGT